MSICPKCGSANVRGPSYVPNVNKLQYTCSRCGYFEYRPPKDRRSAPSKGNKA